MSEDQLDKLGNGILILCLIWFVVPLLYGIFVEGSFFQQEVLGIFDFPPAEGSYRAGMVYTLPLGVLIFIMIAISSCQGKSNLFVALIGGLLLGGAFTFLGVYPIILTVMLVLLPVIALADGSIFWTIVCSVLWVIIFGKEAGKLVLDILCSTLQAISRR